ncbi:MAG TPA: YXWGXW repeat-containing protein [Verrucomicrobiae bacterium]|nr:YXWGXW repeat-containing protein [Verrucomicrobiae bacterium]
MRKRLVSPLLSVVIGSVLTAGCINSHRDPDRVVIVPGQRIVVTEEPPPTRMEVMSTAPGSEHVWIAGHWMRANQRWVWVPGHWEMRPKVGATWTPGRWDKDPDGKGWVWVPGHWD